MFNLGKHAARLLVRGAWLCMACIPITANVRQVHACDVCAIYTTVEAREERTGWRFAFGEQFTYFHTLKNNGETVPNPFGERLASSISQFVVGYNFVPRAGLQLTLPVIARSYRRVESTGVVDGNEEGIGDLSLLGNLRVLSFVDLETVAHLDLLGGLKFPTGNPDRLSEEIPPPPCIPFPDPMSCSPRPRFGRVDAYHIGGPPSGIHGHDLALGSGSVDGIVGVQAFASWKRLYGTAAVQYFARTVGAFGYQYANELLFNTGPGVFVLLGDDWFGQAYGLRAQILFAGDTSGTDSLDGESLGDTGFTGLYLGPAFTFTWGTALAAEIAAELPAFQNTNQLQIVPDYRLRGGVSWRF